MNRSIYVELDGFLYDIILDIFFAEIDTTEKSQAFNFLHKNAQISRECIKFMFYYQALRLRKSL